MTFIERSAMLKAVAKHLLEQKDQFYAISAQTGATRADSWVDIEGGIGTLFTYAGLGSPRITGRYPVAGRRAHPALQTGRFCRASCANLEIRRRRPYQRLQLPCWECWKNWRPRWLAGMPAIIKPATATAQLTRQW
ncbi:hypothetical protein LN650_18035 [Klebsiella pneumoniae subsp. pneumoniae]|nr:hypothetical protein [Klebsiella pneumoniae subsp. pneumoniae]